MLRKLICVSFLLFIISCAHSNGNSNVQDHKKPILTAENCLDGQDMDAPDVDISNCPEIPLVPEVKFVNWQGSKWEFSLGLWEIDPTKEGPRHKWGPLKKEGDVYQLVHHEDPNNVYTTVDQTNLKCWAKGYYRLRHMLTNPPKDYMELVSLKHSENHNVELDPEFGFQIRFFQYQTDKRNSKLTIDGQLQPRPTWENVASYKHYLVKWVTVVERDGSCNQVTISEFEAYAKFELEKRKAQLAAEE